MAFFLIVPSVMIVSIFSASKLANRLGLRIYYATLFASAVLAFMVVVAATFVAGAVSKKFFAVAGLMILAASLLLTWANNFLIRKQRDEEERFTEEVKAAYAAEVEQNPSSVESSAALNTFNWSADDIVPTTRYNEFVDDAPETVEDDLLLNEKILPETSDVQPEKNPPNEKILSQPADVPTAENLPLNEKNLPAVAKSAEKISPAENSAPPKNFPLDEVFKPLAEIKPVEADKPVQIVEKPSVADNFPLDEVFKPLAEVKPDEADKPIRRFEKTKRTEFFPLQEVFEPLSLLNIDKLENLAPAPPADDENLETLDEFLDKAYTERELGHVWQAIGLYKTALERYGNDDYAPFVVIDLGNIYKAEALYSNAIKLYEDALTLPAVERNSDFKREFAANLKYLRVLRDVLLKRGKMSTPFAKLPPEILQEIDTESRKIQVHSAQSK